MFSYSDQDRECCKHLIRNLKDAVKLFQPEMDASTFSDIHMGGANIGLAVLYAERAHQFIPDQVTDYHLAMLHHTDEVAQEFCTAWQDRYHMSSEFRPSQISAEHYEALRHEVLRLLHTVIQQYENL
jgi:hypothetical protein